ncbi:CWC22 [Candida theae]|uniref:Pre-mRNA-splicing factor CWC22 n=1 Tax=Candida theae TaxID=1198502 RepID=A0AAD5BCY5_9ASCO|nr:CWC22 [Candida theae]KAI5953775.1 CWC22 [Candida theae]
MNGASATTGASSATDEEVQRKKWVELQHSIDKIVKNLTNSNIQTSIFELFTLNIKRGRGLLVRSLMHHQLRNPGKSSLYASVIDVINSKIGSIGKLISSRIVLQFKLAYTTDDSALCKSSLQFLSCLTMHQVVNEVTLLQIIQLLLESPVTNGDVVLCTEIFKVVGRFLILKSRVPTTVILNRVKDLVQEDQDGLSYKSQNSLRNLLKLGQSQFKSIPLIDKQLDLVDDEDKQTHVLDLQEVITSKDYLNVYHYDKEFDRHEKEYDALRKEILQDDDVDEEGGVDNAPEPAKENAISRPAEIVSDMTQSDLIQYQKQVYLTVMSSMSSEEAVHKLLKLSRQRSQPQSSTKSTSQYQLQQQQQSSQTLCDMIIKCCSQEKTYSKYFGVIGEILCGKNHHWQNNFITLFKHYYSTIENFEANALRNIGKFFGHLFAADVVPLDKAWDDVRITQQDTNPARRILLKFIFQEMVEELGIDEIKARLINDSYVKRGLNGVFPVVDVDEDDAEHLRFSINFFTAIGLGVLTEEMRHVLNNLPPSARGRGRNRIRGSSSRGSSYSYSRSGGSSSSSGSGSNSHSRSGSYSRSRSQSFSRSRSNSYSRSRSRTPSRESFRRSTSADESKGSGKDVVDNVRGGNGQERGTKRRRSSSSSGSSSSGSDNELQKPKLSDILKKMH